jgi:hypothetical protein
MNSLISQHSQAYLIYILSLSCTYPTKFLSYKDDKVETIIKTRQASHGLIMTRQKGHSKNNVHKEGDEKELTLLDRWTCANGKERSRGHNEVLVIGLHMVGKISMSLDLEVFEKSLSN